MCVVLNRMRPAKPVDDISLACCQLSRPLSLLHQRSSIELPNQFISYGV